MIGVGYWHSAQFELMLHFGKTHVISRNSLEIKNAKLMPLIIITTLLSLYQTCFYIQRRRHLAEVRECSDEGRRNVSTHLHAGICLTSNKHT